MFAFRATCPPQRASSKILMAFWLSAFVVLLACCLGKDFGDSLDSLGENKICIFTLFCYDLDFVCVGRLIVLLICVDFSIKGII